MKIAKSTRTLILLVLIAAALIVLRLIDRTWAPSLADMVGGEEVLATLNTPWFVIGGEHSKASDGLSVTPVLTIQIVLFFVLLTVGARLARRVLQTRVLGRTGLDVGQQYALARIFGYFVFFLGLAIGLQTMGLDLSSLTFLGGAVGIGIGFGLQTIVNNFVSGIIMLVERPIMVGDRVEVGGTSGDVVKIGSRSTWVRGVDNAVTIVPNSEFVTGRVTNLTAMDQQARYRVSVGVGFDSDPEMVRSLLIGIARAHPGVLQDPPPDVVLAGIGDSALRFDLRFSTATMIHAPQRLTSDLYFGILKVFREHKIEIPFPQRDLHLRSVPDSVLGSPRG